MSHRRAKRLRQEMREAGMDPTSARYASHDHGYSEHEVPVVKAFAWVVLLFQVHHVTISLATGCGRSIYQRAKVIAKRLDKGPKV
jgi:hypothetical protein